MATRTNPAWAGPAPEIVVPEDATTERLCGRLLAEYVRDRRFPVVADLASRPIGEATIRVREYLGHGWWAARAEIVPGSLASPAPEKTGNPILDAPGAVDLRVAVDRRSDPCWESGGTWSQPAILLDDFFG